MTPDHVEIEKREAGSAQNTLQLSTWIRRFFAFAMS
jgi:hypothetical protein